MHTHTHTPNTHTLHAHTHIHTHTHTTPTTHSTHIPIDGLGGRRPHHFTREFTEHFSKVLVFLFSVAHEGVQRFHRGTLASQLQLKCRRWARWYKGERGCGNRIINPWTQRNIFAHTAYTLIPVSTHSMHRIHTQHAQIQAQHTHTAYLYISMLNTPSCEWGHRALRPHCQPSVVWHAWLQSQEAPIDTSDAYIYACVWECEWGWKLGTIKKEHTHA